MGNEERRGAPARPAGAGRHGRRRKPPPDAHGAAVRARRVSGEEQGCGMRRFAVRLGMTGYQKPRRQPTRERKSRSFSESIAAPSGGCRIDGTRRLLVPRDPPHFPKRRLPARSSPLRPHLPLRRKRRAGAPCVSLRETHGLRGFAAQPPYAVCGGMGRAPA